MGLYTRKSHEREMRALREEYEQRLGELRAAVSELKEENRRLSAEVALLSSQKAAVSDAMIAAGEAKNRMEAELGEFVRSEKEIAVQAAQRAQALLEEVRTAYPDRADEARFAAFEEKLDALLGAPPVGKDAEDVEIACANAPADADFSAAAGVSDGAAGEAGRGADWDLRQVLDTLGLTEN